MFRDDRFQSHDHGFYASVGLGNKKTFISAYNIGNGDGSMNFDYKTLTAGSSNITRGKRKGVKFIIKSF